MPSILDQVEGQETAVETLKRALTSGRLHHAYLFDGPESVGKELTAFGLAQALLCSAPTTEKLACGSCSSCIRSVPEPESRLAKHPDLRIVGKAAYDPATIGRKTQETQDISVDQIRAIVLSTLGFAPHEGRARVFIVRAADELSNSAANALLKTLEEPHPLTHFILITSNPNALLSTVRSRTSRIRFGNLGPKAVESILRARGIPSNTISAIIKRGCTSVAEGLRWSEESDGQTESARLEHLLSALRAPHFGPGLILAEEAKKDKDSFANDLQLLLSKFAALGTEREEVAYSHAFSAVLNARAELDANVSPQLVAEALYSRLRGYSLTL